MTQLTNAQALARKVALSILKAYHKEIKSGFVSDASAVERERGQSAAFAEAECQIRDSLRDASIRWKIGTDSGWLNATSEES